MFSFFHDLCHRLSSSTNFAHAQTLSRMSSLSGRMNIARINIVFFTGFKKIKQQRISFVLGYLRMILWKISTAISIKHRILATFNIKKINSDGLYAFNEHIYLNVKLYVLFFCAFLSCLNWYQSVCLSVYICICIYIVSVFIFII